MASAKPWRSSTFSLREAAIITSTSPAALALGPITQKSRLTSSRENGMYWLASISTWASISRSLSPPGKMIFLLMTTDAGSAMATCLALVPLFLIRRRAASTTSSNFSKLPSLIQPRSSGSMAQRSSVNSPARSCDNSTSLMLEALTSSPTRGAG